MKILQKNSSNSGPGNRHSKSSKKTKTQKIQEKAFQDANSSDSQEILPKQTSFKQTLKKAHDNDQQSLPKGPETTKDAKKKPNLEKRKQDGGEWKAMRKIDYQRLETVMEEGQLSSEETSSKHNFLESGKSDSGSDVDQTSVPTVSSKKSWLYSLMSLAESPKPEGDTLKKLLKIDRLRLRQHPKTSPPPDHPRFNPRTTNKKTGVVEIGESYGEPSESLAKELAHNKRSVILSGMMEILPIFSNEKFVCPRDAISVEDYEELEGERKGGVSGKALLETKNGKEMKPFVSGGCMQKEGSFEGGFMERLGDFKEITERKLRYKVFTDRNFYQETSSPFINSLLVLTPFSTERERLLSERKHLETVDENGLSTANGQSSDLESEGKLGIVFKAFFGVVMATLCLLMLLLVIAWRWYEPPRFVDSIIDALPMMHSRRSHFQRFFDKLIRFLSTYLNGLNVKFPSSN